VTNDATSDGPAHPEAAAGSGRGAIEGERRANGGGSNRLFRFLSGGGFRGGGEGTVAAAAGIVILGFLGSRVLGLLRSVAIADTFGTDPELDAYWVAFRLPDLVFQVLAGATLSAAFIPTFNGVVLRGGEAAAWRLASSVLNLVAVTTLVVAALAFILAPLIVPLLAPGLGEGSGRQDELHGLAVELTRLMLLSPILFGISGMATGMLHARQRFWAPALAPMIYNASIIFGAVALAPSFGVQGLAAGVLIGAAGHLLVQLPALRSAGMRWRPALDIRSEGVREVGRLMGPRVLGLAAGQINLVVMIFFASFVSDGAVSAVNYAFLMMMLPVGVAGMAISTAVFPTLAQQAAAQQVNALRRSIGDSLRLILFLSVPASAGLLLLAQPAVRLLFERGAFDAASTDLVVDALMLFAVGVFAHAGIEILSRGFYALSDTRTPVQFAVLATVANVALCAAFVSPFGIRGLAAAGSLAAIAEFTLLLRALHTRLDGLDGSLWRSSIQTVLATVVMAQAVALLLLLLRAAGADPHTATGALVLTTFGGLGGLAAYALAALVLRSEEYLAILGRLRS
jgi:putative peptidoglycan lipid II flippase